MQKCMSMKIIDAEIDKYKICSYRNEDRHEKETDFNRRGRTC